jgi:hypothetical protein
MDKPVRTTTQAEVAASPWTTRMRTYTRVSSYPVSERGSRVLVRGTSIAT